MKKEYLKPAVKELFIMSADLLTGTNEVTNTDGNAGIDYGGGSKTMRDHTEFQLWCMPPLFIVMVLLLTAEWIIRKRANLA